MEQGKVGGVGSHTFFSNLSEYAARQRSTERK